MGKKNLWLFLIARFISYTGSGVQMIALPLYILDKTGSGTLMGVFSVLTLVPMLLTAPFSGIIGDRKNRRNVMIATDIGRGALICIMGFLAMMGEFSIYTLFALQVFISIMDSIFNSSSQALLPDLISSEQLIEGNSLKGGLDAAAYILGPALGGVIYGIWGIKMVFIINGSSFFISGFLTLLIIYKHVNVVKEKINPKVFLNENIEVLKFIRLKKGLIQLFSFAMISNFLLAPIFDIVMPYALKKGIGFSSQYYGYVMGFFTVGILIGNVAISIKFKNLGLKKLMRLGLIIETIVSLIFSLSIFPVSVSFLGGAGLKLFTFIATCAAFMGIFNAFVNTPISTNLQNLVPQEMRSRFFAILGMFSQGAIPLGSLIFGILLDLMKYYYLMAAVIILATIAASVFLIFACDEAYEAKDLSTNLAN
ncbi:MFS transporter [Candidatus Clostridium radicumherbarum]|uniref:MFS transporter n=1 Tax=Candidatus Clostridium radicumherbarum TaxID=3381662 RepID=A0ABW8TTG1_9CLOT